MTTALYAHRQHISWTQVEYNARTGSVEISHRLHEHDMAALLRDLVGESADLGDIEHRARVANYVDARFSIQADTQQGEVSLLGAELQGPYLLVYQEMSVSKQPKRFDVSSQILMDVFGDQVNRINVTSGEKVLTLELTKESQAQTVHLEPRADQAASAISS